MRKKFLNRVVSIMPARELSRTAIRVSDRVNFTHHLSRYISAGIPIRQALNLSTPESIRSPHVRMLKLVQDDILDGRSLSAALARFPRVYGPLSCGIIRIGEETGTLSESLMRVSELLRKQADLRRRILGALAYPCCILAGTFAVCAFLILFAFPKIVPLLTSMQTTLPLPTRIMIGVSGTFRESWYLFLLAFFLLGFLGVLAVRTPSLRRTMSFFLLSIPFVRSGIRLYYSATITRLLSVLLGGGVRVEYALSQVRLAISYDPYTEALFTIEQAVVKGNRLSSSMRTYARLFPALVLDLIATGESTGGLPESLRMSAESCEYELSEITRTLTSLIEPALMLLMGSIVGFVALAIILPMYGLTSALSLP